jgi:thioredoxin 1
MIYKSFALIGVLCCLAFGQFPPPVMEETPQFDSSDIMADAILHSRVPVLIDFWATWCGPCRMLGPTMEEIKKEYAGKIKVMKVNVDVNRKISAYFRVSAIPAVFLVKDKTVVSYIQGLNPKEAYENAIKKVLAPPPDTSSQKDIRSSSTSNSKESKESAVDNKKSVPIN